MKVQTGHQSVHHQSSTLSPTVPSDVKDQASPQRTVLPWKNSVVRVFLTPAFSPIRSVRGATPQHMYAGTNEDKCRHERRQDDVSRWNICRNITMLHSAFLQRPCTGYHE